MIEWRENKKSWVWFEVSLGKIWLVDKAEEIHREKDWLERIKIETTWGKFEKHARWEQKDWKTWTTNKESLSRTLRKEWNSI